MRALALLVIGLAGCGPPGFEFAHFKNGHLYHCKPRMGSWQKKVLEQCGEPDKKAKASSGQQCWFYENRLHGIKAGAPAAWVAACFEEGTWGGSPSLDMMLALSSIPGDLSDAPEPQAEPVEPECSTSEDGFLKCPEGARPR